MEANRRKAKNTNHRNVITKRLPGLRGDFDARDFESGTSANSITPAYSLFIIKQTKNKINNLCQKNLISGLFIFRLKC